MKIDALTKNPIGISKIYSLVSLIGTLLIILILMGDTNPGYLCLFVPATCIIIAIQKKKPILTIFSLFISLYFLYLIPYFFFGIGYATRSDYQDVETSEKGLILISIFTMIFLISASRSKQQYINLEERLRREKNPIIFTFCIITILTLTSLMFTEGSIFTSSYRELTEERYGFIDYVIAFTLLSFIFGKSNKYELILISTVGIYFLTCMLYGYRLRAIQILLLIFLLFYEKRFSNSKIIISVVVAIIFMLAIGTFRTATKDLTIASIIGIQGNVIVSNQGGVFLNSNMYIGLVDDQIITTSQRIKTFIGNFISIVISQSQLPEDYHLPKIATKYFTIPGGGLISGYLYVWGGWASVVAGGIIIGGLFKKLYSKKNNQLFLIYGAIIIATMPRWYAYNPIHFFKMGIITIVMYMMFKLSHHLMAVGKNSGYNPNEH